LIPAGRIQYPAMKPGNILQLTLWAASALCSAESITVQVYDYTGMPAGQWAKAQEDAGLVLAKAGYSVIWQFCHGEGVSPESAALCQHVMGPNDFMVRVVPRQQNPATGMKRTLAYSQLDHGRGTCATLYLEAIRAHATELAVSQSILMGYATAHEILHLLQGPAHSRSGVMKESYTRRDAEAIAQLNLPLR
jgi:hypothetical protein